MAVFVKAARTKGEFKDLLLDNLFCITKNAAALFDNVYREITFSVTDDIARCFELLIAQIDDPEALSIPDALWHAYLTLWQAANSLLAAYQSIRVGFPVEAVVIVRHVFELEALALCLFLEPKSFDRFKKRRLKATGCITTAKRLFPDFGRQYGILSDIAHPTMGLLGTYLHEDESGQVIHLVGAGLPDGEPRLIRGALTRLLLNLVELQASYLDACTEAICLKGVTAPQYWQKTEKGVMWNPSPAVRRRWTERGERLLEALKRDMKAGASRAE